MRDAEITFACMYIIFDCARAVHAWGAGARKNFKTAASKRFRRTGNGEKKVDLNAAGSFLIFLLRLLDLN